MCTCPSLHPGRTSEPRARRGRNLLGTLFQGSWLPPTSLYLSSHSRCRCLCQDLWPLPPTPSLSVSEGRAKKGSCHLSLAQGKGLLRPQVGPNTLSRQTQQAWRNSRRRSWSPSGPLQATQSRPGKVLGRSESQWYHSGLGVERACLILAASLIECLPCTRPHAGP